MSPLAWVCATLFVAAVAGLFALMVRAGEDETTPPPPRERRPR